MTNIEYLIIKNELERSLMRERLLFISITISIIAICSFIIFLNEATQHEVLIFMLSFGGCSTLYSTFLPFSSDTRKKLRYLDQIYKSEASAQAAITLLELTPKKE